MHRIGSSLHFTACVFNNRWVSSVLCLFSFFTAFFFTPLMKESMNTARFRLLRPRSISGGWGKECFFSSSTLFPAHTFLILILQTASYTHAWWLTLISGGYSVLRFTQVLSRVSGPPWRPLVQGWGTLILEGHSLALQENPGKEYLTASWRTILALLVWLGLELNSARTPALQDQRSPPLL